MLSIVARKIKLKPRQKKDLRGQQRPEDAALKADEQARKKREKAAILAEEAKNMGSSSKAKKTPAPRKKKDDLSLAGEKVESKRSVEKKQNLTAETESAATPIAFKDLPRELKQRAALFLPHSDLMNLVATSESIRSDLDLEIVSAPLTDRYSQTQRYQTSFQRKCFAVVVPKPEARLHSMTFKCLVGTNGRQGVPANQDPENLTRGSILRRRPRGPRRARRAGVDVQVWVAERDVPEDQDPENLKRGSVSDGDALESLLLDSSQTKLSLSFPVKPNKMYQLYIATRGWGRAVQFSDMRLDRVGFGNTSTGCVSYQFDAYEDYEEHEICR